MRIEFDLPRRPEPSTPKGPPAKPSPEERRLRRYALALHLLEMLATGEAGSQAEIARGCGVSTAVVCLSLSAQ